MATPARPGLSFRRTLDKARENADKHVDLAACSIQTKKSENQKSVSTDAVNRFLNAKKKEEKAKKAKLKETREKLLRERIKNHKGRVTKKIADTFRVPYDPNQKYNSFNADTRIYEYERKRRRKTDGSTSGQDSTFSANRQSIPSHSASKHDYGEPEPKMSKKKKSKPAPASFESIIALAKQVKDDPVAVASHEEQKSVRSLIKKKPIVPTLNGVKPSSNHVTTKPSEYCPTATSSRKHVKNSRSEGIHAKDIKKQKHIEQRPQYGHGERQATAPPPRPAHFGRVDHHRPKTKAPIVPKSTLPVIEKKSKPLAHVSGTPTHAPARIPPKVPSKIAAQYDKLKKKLYDAPSAVVSRPPSLDQLSSSTKNVRKEARPHTSGVTVKAPPPGFVERTKMKVKTVPPAKVSAPKAASQPSTSKQREKRPKALPHAHIRAMPKTSQHTERHGMNKHTAKVVPKKAPSAASRNSAPAPPPFLAELMKTARPTATREVYRQDELESDVEVEDEEYDSEMSDFIDDTEAPARAGKELTDTLKEVFGYDKSKYAHERPDNTRDMEASYKEILKEEARTSRLGRLEDLRELQREMKGE